MPGVLARVGRARELGMEALQVRDHALAPGALAAAAEAIADAHPDLPLLLNGPPGLAADMGLWGVHLPDREPDEAWLAARGSHPHLALTVSAHGGAGLERGGRLGAIAALLGPVRAPISKPEGSAPLGWEAFARLAGEADVPVYALGGLRPGDMERALAAGACGLAMVGGLF